MEKKRQDWFFDTFYFDGVDYNCDDKVCAGVEEEGENQEAYVKSLANQTCKGKYYDDNEDHNDNQDDGETAGVCQTKLGKVDFMMVMRILMIIKIMVNTSWEEYVKSLANKTCKLAKGGD